jgi:O-antigen/teichoic acid export membrane protein
MAIDPYDRPPALQLAVVDASIPTAGGDASEGNGHTEDASEDAHREIGRGTARLVSAAALRQILNTGLLAVTAAVVARALGAHDFGVYAGGTAAYNLAIAFTDLGFGIVVTREMSRSPEQAASMLRSTVQVQFLWSAVIALALFGLGISLHAPRGEVMMVLSPAVLLSGLASWRQIFAIRYRAGPLLVVDVACTLLQAGSMIALALTHAGVLAIAGALGGATVLNVLLAVALARRELGPRVSVAYPRRRILRMALPVGIASLLASLYFTIDQTILGWLVSSRQLGEYAAAVRLLTAIVAVPGFVMAAAMPGLARFSASRADLSRFAAMISHWLAMSGLPLAVGLGVFAHPVIHLVFGAQYRESAGLLEILMVAGCIALTSNVLGVLLISVNLVRAMVVFNLLSLALNVVGNIVLVPRYGVTASAWLTAACELLVVSYALWVLRRRVRFASILTVIWRPLAVTALAAAVGLILGARDVTSVVVAVLTFLIASLVLRAWPREFVPSRLVGIITR